MADPKPGGLVTPKKAEGLLAAIYAANRGLARHKGAFQLRVLPNPGDGRQLEFYPPWESENPVPGKATVDLYNTSESPETTQNLVAGDMLHYLGAIDPRSGQPVDPTFFKLKQQLLQSRTPEQQRIDDRAYQRDLPYYQNPPTQDDWMQFNRGDAYIRGKLTPDADDNWRDMYTPEQAPILELLRQYMTRGSIAPGMNR